jgi:hypothetical protein
MRRYLHVALFAVLCSLAPGLADATPPEGVKIEKKVKAKDVARLFVGEWRVELDDVTRRQLDIMKVAFAENPEAAKAEVAKQSPITEDEEGMIEGVLFAMSLAGDEAEEMRAEQLKLLNAMEDMSFIVGEGTIKVHIGDQDGEATWEPVSTDKNLLVVDSLINEEGHEKQTLRIHFVHANRIAVESEDGVMAMRRL